MTQIKFTCSFLLELIIFYSMWQCCQTLFFLCLSYTYFAFVSVFFFTEIFIACKGSHTFLGNPFRGLAGSASLERYVELVISGNDTVNS